MIDITSWPEFDNHYSISRIYDKDTGLNGFVALHRIHGNAPSFGATRLWAYPSEQAALQDALRLSRTMTYKSAMAGYPYGGGKAVLIDPGAQGTDRKNLLKKYVEFVNHLNGNFVTGADVGIDDEDVEWMHENSPHIVGVVADPVEFTALGVFYSIQVCLQEIFGTETIEGRTFAVQGLGKVGKRLAEMLIEAGGEVWATDIDAERVKEVQSEIEKLHVASLAEIDTLKVDVFCPCALSRCVNTKNVSSLKCKAVVGAANNQLESDQIGKTLHKKGILYAPDYVVNAGGLMSVIDEYENSKYNAKRVEERVATIKQTMQKIITESKKNNIPTNIVANGMVGGEN